MKIAMINGRKHISFVSSGEVYYPMDTLGSLYSFMLMQLRRDIAANPKLCSSPLNKKRRLFCLRVRVAMREIQPQNRLPLSLSQVKSTRCPAKLGAYFIQG